MCVCSFTAAADVIAVAAVTADVVVAAAVAAAALGSEKDDTRVGANIAA